MASKNKKAKDEARERLEDKLNDVRSKVELLHQAISLVSVPAITRAEATLLQKSKSKFMSQYSKTSQELEICLNKLILMSDAISSITNGSCTDSENEEMEGAERTEISIAQEAMSSFTENDTTPNTSSSTPGTITPRKRKLEVKFDTKGVLDYRVTCELCGKHLASKTSLTNHIKTRHTTYEDWPYVCSLCPEGSRKRYALPNRLKEHIEYKHLGHTTSVCEICGKGFGRPNHKVRHEAHCRENQRRNSLNASTENTEEITENSEEITENTEEITENTEENTVEIADNTEEITILEVVEQVQATNAIIIEGDNNDQVENEEVEEVLDDQEEEEQVEENVAEVLECSDNDDIITVVPVPSEQVAVSE